MSVNAPYITGNLICDQYKEDVRHENWENVKRPRMFPW